MMNDFHRKRKPITKADIKRLRDSLPKRVDISSEGTKVTKKDEVKPEPSDNAEGVAPVLEEHLPEICVPLSAEEIRMTDPAIRDRLTKRSNGFLLFNDIVERLRSEPSVQRQVFFHGYSPLNRKSPSRPKCKQIRLPRGTRGNPLTAASFRT